MYPGDLEILAKEEAFKFSLERTGMGRLDGFLVG